MGFFSFFNPHKFDKKVILKIDEISKIKSSKYHRPETGYLLKDIVSLNKDLKRVKWKETEDVGITTFYKGKSFSGIAFSVNDAGIIESECELKNGLKNGNSITYFANSKIKKNHNKPQLIRTYKDDKLHGYFEEYWENGNLKARSEFKNGIKVGLEKVCFEDGKIETLASVKKGKGEGLFRFWKKDGTLEVFNMKNSTKDGVYEAFHSNGDIAVFGKYKNNNRVDKWFYFIEGEFVYMTDFNEKTNKETYRNYSLFEIIKYSNLYKRSREASPDLNVINEISNICKSVEKYSWLNEFNIINAAISYYMENNAEKAIALNEYLENRKRVKNKWWQ